MADLRPGAALVLGVDAGGTKTDACLLTLDGDVLGLGHAGPGNWEAVGVRAAADAVARATRDALGDRPAARVVAATFAMAGVDWPDDKTRLAPALGAITPAAQPDLVNDAYAALAAGAPDGAGIVSIAGTGGLTAGRNQAGDTFRTMGQLLGEAGGAISVVTRALAAVARSRNGVAPATLLSSALADFHGVASADRLFAALSRGELDVRADAAPVVFEAARDGDAAAAAVVGAVARDHARDVHGVATRLGLDAEPFTLVRAGGVALSANPVFDREWSAAVTALLPRARETCLAAPPVAGAGLLALRRLGLQAAALHARVLQNVAAAARA
ncbi:BadF/BadG/BcrA/BcrD ATPase family protein [Actinoplanes sp. NPDC026619]|uniref:BadF/BadG/BcrA/BcrD ATPase family protein n=1 Tax=Actinoplanes sp. NPDC026619 TaxID=3155798 RepID=UPI0033EA37D6